MSKHKRSKDHNKLLRSRILEKAAKKVTLLKLIYAYGGGRGATRMVQPPSYGLPWTDCSGFVQWLCEIAGIKLKNFVGSTWSLAEEGEAGWSEYFTLCIKNNPGDEHVIARLRKRPRPWHRGVPKYRWIECGGSDNPNPGGGPAFIRPSDARIAEFPIHRHFPNVL